MRDSGVSPRISPVCNVLRQWKTSLIPTYRVYPIGFFTLHQKSNRIRTGLKPDRGNAHSMRIDRVHTAFLAQPHVYSPPSLRMSRDCHARAVLLVKNGSCTMDNRDVSLPSIVPRRVSVLLVLLWAFLRLRRTHRALRVSKERRFLRRWSGSTSLHRARS